MTAYTSSLLTLLLVMAATASDLKIQKMSFVDLTELSLLQHACSQQTFNKCEQRFQKHVKIAMKEDDEDKQELWCLVLKDHESCMNDAVQACMVDYPILSQKIQKSLKTVVHRGCTHKGQPIENGCTDTIRKKKSQGDKDQSLLDLASSCLESNADLEPELKELLLLLQDLTRGMRHLYKRLPKE